MKFILKLLSTVTLTSLSVINLNACGVEQGPPQTFKATFNKINKFNISIINMSIPIMDLKLYKSDVVDKSGSFNDFYNKYGYIKLEISGKPFTNFLNVYGLIMNNTEKDIKDKLSNTIVSNGNITIIKQAPYADFYYIKEFSGKI